VRNRDHPQSTAEGGRRHCRPLLPDSRIYGDFTHPGAATAAVGGGSGAEEDDGLLPPGPAVYHEGLTHRVGRVSRVGGRLLYQLGTAVAKDAKVPIPVLSIGNWNWLQPYAIDVEKDGKAAGGKVASKVTKYTPIAIEHVDGPATVREGSLHGH